MRCVNLQGTLMEIAFKFISKYLYFSPKKKHFHKDLRSLLLTALMQNFIL